VLFKRVRALKEQRLVTMMAQQTLQTLENARIVIHYEDELSNQDAIPVVTLLRAWAPHTGFDNNISCHPM
jgi:hypothetical protein